MLVSESLADALRVLAGYGFVWGKIEDVPRVCALCRLKAKAQPGIGFSRASGEAEPVNPGRRAPACVPAALGELAPQRVDGAFFRHCADIRLAAGGKLSPEGRAGRTVLALWQRDIVHKAGGVRPVGIHQRAEQQPLHEAARKLALSGVRIKAL